MVIGTGRVEIGGKARSGIGGSTAARLAAEGADVMLVDRDLAVAEATASDIRKSGGSAHAIHGDLTDESTLAAAAAAAVEEFGGIDLLVNSGYKVSPLDTDVVTTPQEIWDQIFNVNVMGCVRSCRVVIPHLIERGGGAIVNVSSGTAVVAERIRIAYATSKLAIVGLTRNIAIEYADRNIRCNSVAPGVTSTPDKFQHLDDEQWKGIELNQPLLRFGTPEEQAGAICFLLSPDAGYVTGQLLVTDGGYTASAMHEGLAMPLREELPARK
jgi:NAD(P)-dependent dehydrogenase (short-subunit alcohol dehydrogenase family)